MKLKLEHTEQSKVWLTADLHLGHHKIIQYCNRPFQGLQEMNETLIANWNDVVADDDFVICAGDFAFKDDRKLTHFVARLNGKIILVYGNHDNQKRGGLFYKACDLLDLTVKDEIMSKTHFMVVSHYCLRTWNRSHFNSWHLYGHSHGGLPPIGKSWDVGVDNNEYAPISFERVCEIMTERPDNPNLIKKERKS